MPFPLLDRFKLFLPLGLLLFASSLFGQVSAIGPIGISVADVERETAFFRDVLAFAVGATTEAGGAEQDRRFALAGARTRSATLRLGGEQIGIPCLFCDYQRRLKMASRK